MGTSYSAKEIDAYEAVINLSKLIGSFIKNPPDLKEPVAVSMKTIQDAKEASANLRQEHAETMAAIGLAKADLSHANAEHDRKKAELTDLSKHLSDRAQSLDGQDRESTKKRDLLNERERLVVVRENTAEKRHADLARKETDLNERAKMLADKDQNLSARENKIKSAFA